MENKMRDLIETLVFSIVDVPDKVSISEVEDEKGTIFNVSVGSEDVGKIIGKQGRIANAIRTLAKAAGAKRDKRVMVNVLNKATPQ
jgi:predicted RNA-binding protein YlqC (UPF0109 family)